MKICILRDFTVFCIAFLYGVAEVENYIDTGTFIRPEDFVHYLKPEKLIIEEKAEEGEEETTPTNVILQNNTAAAWYFLFKFTIMDRSGRLVPTAWDVGMANSWENKNTYNKLIGWMQTGKTPNLRLPNKPEDGELEEVLNSKD